MLGDILLIQETHKKAAARIKQVILQEFLPQCFRFRCVYNDSFSHTHLFQQPVFFEVTYMPFDIYSLVSEHLYTLSIN